METAFERISGFLAIFNVRAIHSSENTNFFKTVILNFELRVPSTCCVPCEFGNVYVGETNLAIQTSVMAVHGICDHTNHMSWKNTS
jgi:hypothetical protein